MIDPVTVSVIHGALETIAVEMGFKLMRMAHSSIIRESEDFGAAIIDRHGRGLAEFGAVDAVAVRPPARLRARRAAPAGGARRTTAPGRRGDAQRPVRRRQPRPGRRLHRAGLFGRRPGRLHRDHRAPSRHRRAHARQLRHRRRDRRLRRGVAVQSHQGVRPGAAQRRGLATAARQHPRVRPRGRRHGGASRGGADRRGPAARPDPPLRLFHLRGGERGSARLHRTFDAPGDRRTAGRHLDRGNLHRRLSPTATTRRDAT